MHLVEWMESSKKNTFESWINISVVEKKKRTAVDDDDDISLFVSPSRDPKHHVSTFEDPKNSQPSDLWSISRGEEAEHADKCLRNNNHHTSKILSSQTAVSVYRDTLKGDGIFNRRYF